MTITEMVSWRGQQFVHTWLPDCLPTGIPITQVSGLCWTPERQLLLVSKNCTTWQLPGGHPEPGERMEQTLAREVMEEACAQVIWSQLLGAQRVESEGRPAYIQARFVAWVHLLPFRPMHETIDRRAVAPEEFLETLSWGQASIAAALLRLAVASRNLAHNRTLSRQQD